MGLRQDLHRLNHQYQLHENHQNRSEKMSSRQQQAFNKALYERTLQLSHEGASTQHADFWDDFSQMAEEAMVQHEKPLAPGTLRIHAQMEGKIRTFSSKFIEQLGLQYDVDTFLSKDGPPLEVDRMFLKLLLRFIARRDVGQGGLAIETVQRRWHVVIYLLQKWLERSFPRYITDECQAYLFSDLRDQACLLAARHQPDMNVQDLLDLVHDGCFSAKFLFKNPEDRLQLITFLCLLAYSGARAGELSISWLYQANNDALKYSDLDFFIIRSANGRHKIEIDVTVRNMKGVRDLDNV